MMKKYIKLFAIPILTIIALGVSFFIQQTPISNAAPLPSFDKTTNGLVTNFKQNQQFGGRFASVYDKMTYNVFIPTGSDFRYSYTMIHLMGSRSGDTPIELARVMEHDRDGDSCSQTAGGYNCSLTWDFSNKFPAGTYELYIELSGSGGSDGYQPLGYKSRVFFDVPGIGPVDYNLATIGQVQVSLEEPYDTPYASFKDITASTLNVVDKETVQAFPVKVELNKAVNPLSVEFYLDGKLMKIVTESSEVDDSRYEGGKASVFTYNFTDIDELSNGLHSITAFANGSNYRSEVQAADGQNEIKLAVNFANDPACTDKMKAIGTVTLSAVNSQTNQLNDIEIIDRKVRQYFIDNPKELPEYNNLVKAADEANKDAYTSMANLVKANNFKCDYLNTGIDTFIEKMDKMYESLVEYRDSVIDLINAVGEL
ncbi:MAG: hypothetical protein WBI29_02755 [Candidatus Saccharimonadales bacterium]